MSSRTEQLLIDFRAELNKLMPAVEVVDGMSGYVELVREKADTIQKETERILKEAEKISKRNMEDSKRTLEEFSDQRQQEMEPLIQTLSDMLGELTRLLDYFKSIDLPGKFERIEIRLDNLNTGIQNLYGRIDALERTIRDENARIMEMNEQARKKLNGVSTTVIVIGVVQFLIMCGFFVVLYLK